MGFIREFYKSIKKKTLNIISSLLLKNLIVNFWNSMPGLFASRAFHLVEKGKRSEMDGLRFQFPSCLRIKNWLRGVRWGARSGYQTPEQSFPGWGVLTLPVLPHGPWALPRAPPSSLPLSRSPYIHTEHVIYIRLCFEHPLSSRLCTQHWTDVISMLQGDATN